MSRVLPSEPIQQVKHVLIGKPLRTEEAPHQAISKKVGLAVFASDNLSSVAYATQEILVVLAGAAVLAGSAAAAQNIFALSIPISFAIVGLLVMLTISYRQTIFAYPSGGGAYVVARDNFGEIPAQIAGAALLTDYILTVAVSISSGVEQVASLFPALQPYRVALSVAAVLFMMMMNLRGIKESGAFFAVPTYFFIATMLFTLGLGVVQWITGSLGTVQGVVMMHHTAESLTLFLILKAFSSGSAAVTGVEAIANGIQAFKDPKSKNAATTLLVMATLLGVMFIGTSVLAHQIQAVPSEQETVIFQIGDVVLGPLVPVLVVATTLILILAANTAFSGFPLLAALQAGDGYLPRQLKFRGSRLVFSWGIVVLAAAAIALIVIFNARTTLLIPLYAIGVFLSFSLSQWGMVVRWHRTSRLKPGESEWTGHSTISHDPRWRSKQIVNIVGGTLSVIVLIIFAVTKFTAGAWITVILIPSLVLFFLRVHRHYHDVARILSLGKVRAKPTPHPVKTIVLVDDVHRGTVRVVDFAKSLGRSWTPIHVDYDDRKTELVQQKWRERIGEGELTILKSPYRRLVDPIRAYVEAELKKSPDGFVHIIMGQLVMDTPWARALHSNNSLGIMNELQQMDRVIVTDVPYQLHVEDLDRFPENEPGDYQITHQHDPVESVDHAAQPEPGRAVPSTDGAARNVIREY
jgi:amino acid transporter